MNDVIIVDNIIDDFIDYVYEYLEITDDKPEIILSYDINEAVKMKSFAAFIPSDKYIRVIVINRNLADVLRSLAHEITHYKQLLENRLNIDSGNDGTDIENEANSVAGVVMREYGRINPKIYTHMIHG